MNNLLFRYPRAMILLAIFSFICGQPAEFQISGSNYFEYWLFYYPPHDDSLMIDSTYQEHLEEKLKVIASYGNITVKGVFFLWDPSLFINRGYNYFDYSFDYRKDPVNLILGRYYTTLGRGLCLNQYLDEDFRVDNSLKGIKGGLNFYHQHLTLLSGRTRNLFFEQNAYKIITDTVISDQIRAVNWETDLIPGCQLASRYVRVNRRDDLTPKAFTELYGGDININYKFLETYVEYAQLLGCQPVIGGRITGSGLYASLGFARPGFGAAFQYMDYDSLDVGGAGYRYNEPPTPIKSGISVNRGNDEKGFGGMMVCSPLKNITGELNYSQLKTHDRQTGVEEAVIKISIHHREKLELTGNLEYQVKNKIEFPIREKTELKPNINITYDLGSFYLEGELEQNNIQADTSSYRDQSVLCSIGKAEIFALTLRYEHRNRVPEWLVDKISSETNWPLAELNLQLTHRHALRVRIGAEKGGLVCMGGICRWEAPFKGIKIVFTSMF